MIFCILGLLSGLESIFPILTSLDLFSNIQLGTGKFTEWIWNTISRVGLTYILIVFPYIIYHLFQKKSRILFIRDNFRISNLCESLLHSKKLFRESSFLTGKGHFVLLLSILYGYFYFIIVKDFVVLILASGSLVVIITMFILNIIQYVVNSRRLDRNKDLSLLQINFNQIEVLKDLPIHLNISNLFLIPLLKLKFEISISLTNNHSQGSQRIILIEIVSTNRIQYNESLRFQKRGEYSINDISISSMDRFGFTRILWKLRSNKEILITPALITRNYSFLKPDSTLDESFDPAYHYLDGDYYEHRLYEYGDDVRRVNWKLSGKMNEIYIKIPEPREQAFQNIYIFCSPYLPENLYSIQTKIDEQLEDFLSQLVSYINYLIKYGYRVFFSTKLTENRLRIVNNFNTILSDISRIEWCRENSMVDHLKSYIQYLKDDNVKIDSLSIFTPSVHESLFSDIFQLISKEKISCTIISRKYIFKDIMEQKKGSKEKYNWFSNSSPNNRLQGIRLGELLLKLIKYNHAINFKYSKASQLEDANVIKFNQNIINNRCCDILKIKYV